MKRIVKGSMVLLLAAPLLLGAAASEKRTIKKDVTVQTEAAKTTSNAPRVIMPAAQPLAPTPEPAVVGVPTPAAVSSPTAFSIGWSSINGGGTTNASSTNFTMSNSVGQSAAGQASSPNFQMGIGFWYGAGGGCNCPHQGDIVQSGAIDVQDVLQCIKVAFTNGTDITDPSCPKSRCNVNNIGAVDVSDVLYIIKTAFLNGPAPVNPCGP